VEARRAQVGRRTDHDIVHTGREAPGVQDAGDRSAVRADDARLQMGCRAHDADAVDVLEVPQRRTLVCHAVLQADDRCRRTRHPGQRLHGSVGVVALHAEQHDIVRAQTEFCRAGSRVDLDDVRRLGRLHGQPVSADRGQMGTARDQRYLVAGDRQQPADQATDRTRTEHHISHGVQPRAPRYRGRSPGSGWSSATGR
jgi:hypothetical protein